MKYLFLASVKANRSLILLSCIFLRKIGSIVVLFLNRFFRSKCFFVWPMTTGRIVASRQGSLSSISEFFFFSMTDIMVVLTTFLRFLGKTGTGASSSSSWSSWFLCFLTGFGWAQFMTCSNLISLGGIPRW